MIDELIYVSLIDYLCFINRRSTADGKDKDKDKEKDKDREIKVEVKQEAKSSRTPTVDESAKKEK